MYIHVWIIYACGVNCTQSPTVLITHGQPYDASCKHYTIGGPKMRVFSSNILFLSKYLVSITCSNDLFRNFARAMLMFSRDICDVFLV